MSAALIEHFYFLFFIFGPLAEGEEKVRRKEIRRHRREQSEESREREGEEVEVERQQRHRGEEKAESVINKYPQ